MGIQVCSICSFNSPDTCVSSGCGVRSRTHLSGTIGEIAAFPEEHTGNVGFLHRFVSIFSVILFSPFEILHLMQSITGYAC
jgi:hypothetical protein